MRATPNGALLSRRGAKTSAAVHADRKARGQAAGRQQRPTPPYAQGGPPPQQHPGICRGAA
eukprot:9692196-Lingulodinium_polyedra.AAC.1